MDGVISQARLQALCGHALPPQGGGRNAGAVIDALGPLGQLWLKDEVLHRAALFRAEVYGESPPDAAPRRPPLVRGQCGILLAMENPRGMPLLRPAFVLPVEWRHGGVSSRLLPAGLAEFAGLVLSDMSIEGLSLHLPAWMSKGGADLSRLRFSYDSAWAPLAGGAFVAQERGSTVTDVLATAAWDGMPNSRGSIRRVELVAEKLDAAVAAAARIVFVPRENRGDVAAWRESHPDASIDVRFLDNRVERPAVAIAELLHALEVPPSLAVNGFEECCRYYTRMPRPGQNAYYCEHLLDGIVKTLRPTVLSDPRLAGIDGVIVMASPNWGIACLMAGIFDPARVLLLHDPTMSRHVPDMVAALRRAGHGGGRERDVTCREFEPDAGLAAGIEDAVMGFAATCGRVAVDLTAAYRHYMFTLLASLPPNAVATYIETRQEDTHRSVIPESAELHVVRIPGARQ